MSKDIERVSINKFETALCKENIITETLSGADNVVFQIKRTISLTEMMAFVQDVVESCIDGETGDYIPEAYDFAIRTAVLTHYANFAMPSSLEKQYWLIYNTSAFQQTINNINEQQFSDIIRAIDRKIKYMVDIMSSTAISKIYEVINKFNDIAATGEKIFSDASTDDMSNFIKGVSRLNNLTQEDIAKAILDMKKEEQ